MTSLSTLSSLSSRFSHFPRSLGAAAGTLMLLASSQAFAATAVVVAPTTVYVRPPKVVVATPPKVVVAPPPQMVVATTPLPTVVVKATPLPRAAYVAPHAIYVAHPMQTPVRVPGHWVGGVWVPAHLA
ncbi:hypothetical protein [Cupriavidus sp. RAF12]|uniref:hypothetical protein n=1 Tax=Cupriavidus sp. RAF12 TaxID=3233050 RepID=UPI003F8D9D42